MTTTLTANSQQLSNNKIGHTYRYKTESKQTKPICTDLSITEDTVIAVSLLICHMIIFHTRLGTYLNDKVIDNAISEIPSVSKLVSSTHTSHHHCR